MESTVASLDQPAVVPVETASAHHPRGAAAGAGWRGSRRTRRATMVSVARAGMGVAGVAALAACGTGASDQAGGGVKAPSGPVEMEFLHFFTGVLWDNGFKPIIDEFEQKYPNIKWKGNAIPYGEMHTKIVTLVAGGTPPDGMSVPSDRAAELIMRRVLHENDSYLAKDKSVPIADVYPARLLNYKLADKLYALPIDNGSEAVYYNKALFDEAGVPYPKNDWTWDDLLDKARKLTRKDDPNRPVHGFQYATSLHRFYSPFAGQGGEYFDKDLTKTLLDSGASVKALQWFLDLRCKHAVAPTPQQAADLAKAGGGGQVFGMGNYAMEYTWIGLIAYLHTPQSKIGDNWDVAPIPQALPGGKRYNIVSGQGFAVIQGAKQADAAWIYNTFMLTDPIQKMLGVNGVWFPSRRSLAKFGQPSDGIPKNYLVPFHELVDQHGVSPWWYVPGYNDWEQAILKELTPCWSCERNADDAARTVAPIINELLKQRPTSF
jgi:multiple sugar transport system substrate-binding protein